MFKNRPFGRHESGQFLQAVNRCPGGAQDGKLISQRNLSLSSAMNRIGAIRTATLIALPFLLLPAGIWLGLSAARQFPVLDWWGVVRWSVRAVYIGGAYWGWRAGRPRWFYPWLGFAVYEAVATLLSLAVLVMDGLFFRHNGAVAGYLGLAALSARFRPLHCSRALGRLATVATTSGRLHRLSPRRVDHSSRSLCRRRGDAATHLGRNASVCCRSRIVRRAILDPAINHLAETRKSGACSRAFWRRATLPTLQSGRRGYVGAWRLNRYSLPVNPVNRPGLADLERAVAATAAAAMANPCAEGGRGHRFALAKGRANAVRHVYRRGESWRCKKSVKICEDKGPFP